MNIDASVLIAEEIRGKVKICDSLINCRATDWYFQNDTFMQGWVTLCISKERGKRLDGLRYFRPTGLM